MSSAVELVYFDGCPNLEQARVNLRVALQKLGRDAAWKEWNLDDGDTPDRLRGYPSPAVLVEGRDVSGSVAMPAESRACSALGAPDVATIRAALEGRAA